MKLSTTTTLAIILVVVAATALFTGLLIHSTHESCCERWTQTETKLNKAIDNQVSLARQVKRHIVWHLKQKELEEKK